MIEYIIDASVAIKWVLPTPDESLIPEASQLFSRYKRGEVNFFAPDLFSAEVGNVLWKAVRLGRISQENANHSLQLLLDLGIDVLPARALIRDALSFAITFHRSVYDAIYVTAASRSGCTLITADERLANAVGSRFPVRWLGALEG